MTPPGSCILYVKHTGEIIHICALEIIGYIHVPLQEARPSRRLSVDVSLSLCLSSRQWRMQKLLVVGWFPFPLLSFPCPPSPILPCHKTTPLNLPRVLRSAESAPTDQDGARSLNAFYMNFESKMASGSNELPNIFLSKLVTGCIFSSPLWIRHWQPVKCASPWQRGEASDVTAPAAHSPLRLCNLSLAQLLITMALAPPASLWVPSPSVL